MRTTGRPPKYGPSYEWWRDYYARNKKKIIAKVYRWREKKRREAAANA